MKNHKKASILGTLAVFSIVYFVFFRNQNTTAKAQYIEGNAEKTTIVVSVSASGQMAAESQIELKPGSSGTLTALNVKAGDTVKAGQQLAMVDQSSNIVALNQAKASVLKAQADYDTLVKGLTGTDLALAQADVETAEENLEKAKRDLQQEIADQKLLVERAYNKLLNSGLTAVSSYTPNTASIAITGNYNGKTEGAYTISFYNTAGSGVFYQSSGLGSESGVLKRGSVQSLGNGLFMNISESGSFNDSATTYTIDIPNKKSTDYYTNLNVYNDALTNQTKAIRSAEDSVKTSETNLKNAKLQFQQKTEPADNSELAQSRASLLSAQASLQSAANNYNNNILKSPFDGVVAAVNNKVGDQITSASVVATVITKQQIAEVALNEVDAAKVKVGQKATLTFDAMDSLELTGKVVDVSSIGETSQGVVSYTVKIALDSQNENIKPGMSVSANIITDIKTDVLAVPISAIKTISNQKVVQILGSDGQLTTKQVEPGISNDTLTEIISGLSAGEKIVTQTITANVAGSSTTNRSTQQSVIPGLGGSTGRTGNQVFIAR